MVDATDRNRRYTDQRLPQRVRLWWSSNWFAAVVFVLLGVIVAGEVSDFLDDRARERREEAAERREVAAEEREQQLVCAVENLATTSAESLLRLRQQAPVIQAARAIIEADTLEEREAAVARLEAEDVPVFDPDDLEEPRDCG